MNIKRIVLDVMKPFEPSIIEWANTLSSLDSVASVNISVIEIDKEIENIKITLTGDNLDYDNIKTQINDLAGAIHSIDLVSAGKDLIESPATPQDLNASRQG